MFFMQTDFIFIPKLNIFKRCVQIAFTIILIKKLSNPTVKENYFLKLFLYKKYYHGKGV